jgi:two-component system cell cycle sensor histidine kinase PleC
MPIRKHSESYPQLLSLAVHELRTPASVVSGYLRMLQRDVDQPLPDRQRKMIDEAEKSCGRIVALIAELSDISKLDAGLIAPIRERFDLFVLLHEVADGMHEASDRKVRLEVRGERVGAWMVGDQSRLRTALAAILRATLREQPDGYTVVAECRLQRSRRGRVATLIVAEDGGIQAAHDARPEPFDEKRGGNGLALPIARRVIEAHGGRLWSPQASKSRGTALVSLPLTELNR